MSFWYFVKRRITSNARAPLEPSCLLLEDAFLWVLPYCRAWKMSTHLCRPETLLGSWLDQVSVFNEPPTIGVCMPCFCLWHLRGKLICLCPLDNYVKLALLCQKLPVATIQLILSNLIVSLDSAIAVLPCFWRHNLGKKLPRFIFICSSVPLPYPVA